MNTSLGDRNSLLFHCFVNSDLILDIHFVEFVDRTDSIVCEHQRPCFDGEISCFLVLHDRCGKTSS